MTADKLNQEKDQVSQDIKDHQANVDQIKNNLADVNNQVKKSTDDVVKRFWCKNNPESCLTHFDSHYQTILPIIRLTIVMPKNKRY